MAAKQKSTNGAPRHPEKKFGPFHGGVGLAIWLNEVKTEEGLKYFRSVSLQPRRYRDAKTGKWKDAKSLRPTDLPAIVLSMEAAMQYIAATPLPGEAAEGEEVEALAEGEVPTEASTVF